MNSKKYEVNEKVKASSTSPLIHYKPNESPSIHITANTQEGSSRVLSQRSLDSNDNSSKYPELRRNLSIDPQSTISNLSTSPGNKNDHSITYKKSSNIASGFSSLSKNINKIFKKERSSTLHTFDNQSNNQDQQMNPTSKCKTDTNFTSYVSQMNNEIVNRNSSVDDAEKNNSMLFGATVMKPFTQFGKINQSISLNFDPNKDDLIIPSNGSTSKKMDLKQKLDFLTLEEYVDLQRRSLDKLEERLNLKVDLRDTLKAEKNEINNYLVDQNSCIRSSLEIERLRGEIRSLANEKAKLEQKYTQQSNWICKKCTYSNCFDSHVCIICDADREDDEILICDHCGQKNSLTNLSCVGCNACFNVESSPIEIDNERVRLNSTASSNSNSTNLNRIISNTGSTSSLNSAHNSVAASMGHVQPSIPFIPSSR